MRQKQNRNGQTDTLKSLLTLTFCGFFCFNFIFYHHFIITPTYLIYLSIYPSMDTFYLFFRGRKHCALFLTFINTKHEYIRPRQRKKWEYLNKNCMYPFAFFYIFKKNKEGVLKNGFLERYLGGGHVRRFWWPKLA